jgi:ribonucleoside-diphosphate reductase alpha chain
MVQKGDEVLDYKEAVLKFPDAYMVIEDGGAHHFDGFEKLEINNVLLNIVFVEDGSSDATLSVLQQLAKAESNYHNNPDDTELLFFHHLASGDFIPASPILMNAGNNLQYLFSDHALDVPDSLEEIFDVLKMAATIQQHGGGVGFNFSKIRPLHDSVQGMKNIAFGPLNVLKIFDTSFSAIIQGGRRVGANMGVLHISHPDILLFIEAKKQFGILQNFNLSVAITNDFMEAVENNEEFSLINPRNKEVVKKVSAVELFDAIVQSAWATGDPGIIFIDEMNNKYPFKNERVLCTGSCGQYELESFEGVPYAHINLPKMLKREGGKVFIDKDKLKYITHLVVRFLDDVVDMHKYISPLFEERSKRVRKIGLGVLGFADLLFALRIPYGSEESLKIIEEIMTIIRDESRKASYELAMKRGSFPDHQQSSWKQPMRHATITSIAPTGSTSMIAQTSPSIEPVYAFSFTTTTSEGKEYTILNKAFKEAVDALPIDKTSKIQLQFVDSVQKISWLDEEFKEIFKTAMDVSPEEHLKVLSTFQKYVDNSISKTINLPHDYTQQQVAEIIKEAYRTKCKGITIYRDGCREDQVLMTKTQTKLSAFEDDDGEQK